MNLRFIYVTRSNEYKENLRNDWFYVYQMSKFFRWWLRKKFALYYTVNADVLVVTKTPLMRFRFGMRELMKHHQEKGVENYHFYISYFKPVWTDCSAGFFTDNMGLIQWKKHTETMDKYRFFAIENCARISHILLHEVGRQKHYDNKKFKEQIHEQWDKHVYDVESYELYDRKFKLVTENDEFMFATMKIPEH